MSFKQLTAGILSLVLVFGVFAYEVFPAQATTCDFGSDIGGGQCRGYLTTADGGAPLNYYIDGHIGISDPNAVWTNDANAFDGSTATQATASVSGSTSSNYLYGQGTNAPSSGNAINQVTATVYASNAAGGDTTTATIFTSGLAETLGSPAGPISGTGFGTPVTLTAPTGGWSWSVIDSLETKIFHSAAGSDGVFEVKITVTTSGVWTVPADWNASNNTVELIGAGGGGGGGSNITGGGNIDSAGGGGAYTKLSNGAVSGTVTFSVGVGGTGATPNVPGNNGGLTCWENTTATDAYCSGGGNGISAIVNNGGTASTTGSPPFVFTVSITNSGGNSGTGNVFGASDGGIGGGAAGGLNGVGAVGAPVGATNTHNGGNGGAAASGGNNGVSSISSTGGNGGAGFDSTAGGTGSGSGVGGTGSHGSGGGGGFGTGAGTASFAGGTGGIGIEYDSTHGSGGGGGGGGGNVGGGGGNASNNGGNGGNGGNFGGGGGGGGGGGKNGSTPSTGGSGANGLIIITYTPSAPAPTGPGKSIVTIHAQMIIREPTVIK